MAQRHQFVTPGDWFAHRFGSPALTLVANLLLVAAIANYLLAQLMAMGLITAGLSGGAVPYWVGVVLLTLVVLVYETVGGMRAVAWTDTVQGLMLMVGLTGLLVAAAPTPDHLTRATESIAATSPDKTAVPGWGRLSELDKHPRVDRVLRCGLSACDPADLRRPGHCLLAAFVQRHGLPADPDHRVGVSGWPAGYRTARRRRQYRGGPGDATAAHRVERALAGTLRAESARHRGSGPARSCRRRTRCC